MAGGRPTDYKPEFCEQAKRLSLLGATDKQMAEFFDVSEQTLNSWKQKYPEFLESLKSGKLGSDSKVAASLFQRAVGYEYDSEEIKTLTSGSGGSYIERVPIKKHVSPDVTAQIFWLKNRQPQLWRDKHEVHQTINGPDISALTPEELYRLKYGDNPEKAE